MGRRARAGRYAAAARRARLALPRAPHRSAPQFPPADRRCAVARLWPATLPDREMGSVERRSSRRTSEGSFGRALLRRPRNRRVHENLVLLHARLVFVLLVDESE